MNRRFLIAIACLVTIAGCFSASLSTTGIKVGDVRCEFRNLEVSDKETGPDRLKCQAGEYQFLLSDGSVVVNGLSYGAVSEGDHVLLDEGGRLYVNGTERHGIAAPLKLPTDESANNREKGAP